MKVISIKEFWRYLREGVVPTEDVCVLDTYDCSASPDGTWRTMDAHGKLGYLN